jgi:hypothetical protein
MAEENKPGLPASVTAALKSIGNLPDLSKLSRIAQQVDSAAKALNASPALSIFPKLQELATPHIKAVELFQQQIRPLTERPAYLKQLEEHARRAQAFLPQMLERDRVLRRVALTDLRRQKLERIGLLPHPSTPFAALDAADDDEAIKSLLLSHYRDDWPEISARIRERMQGFDIDDEAKATFAETLDSHRYGHFRSVCRTLLPEVERVARVEMERKDLGTTNPGKILAEPASELYISDTDPPGIYAMDLYRRLTEHFYVKVDDDNLAKLKNDPVPNRHAAIHGFVVYNSVWHSLNVIFLADYAFQIITAIKAARRASVMQEAGAG